MQAKVGVAIPEQVVRGVSLAPPDVAGPSAKPNLVMLLPMHAVIRAEALEVTVVEAADRVVMVAITGTGALEPFVADCAARPAAARHPR
jgi:hypothetical protein